MNMASNRDRRLTADSGFCAVAGAPSLLAVLAVRGSDWVSCLASCDQWVIPCVVCQTRGKKAAVS